MNLELCQFMLLNLNSRIDWKLIYDPTWIKYNFYLVTWMIRNATKGEKNGFIYSERAKRKYTLKNYRVLEISWKKNLHFYFVFDLNTKFGKHNSNKEERNKTLKFFFIFTWDLLSRLVWTCSFDKWIKKKSQTRIK